MKRMSKSLRVTVILSMLAAISIICGKYLAINGGEVMRFSLENMPIIFAGMAFGPAAGAIVGVVADLVGCLMVAYTVNPLITLGAAAIGAISGVIPSLLIPVLKDKRLITVITVAASHIIGSVLIKTVGLAAYYDMPLIVLMLWRMLNYVIVGIIDGIVVHILINHKGIKSHISDMNGDKK